MKWFQHKPAETDHVSHAASGSFITVKSCKFIFNNIRLNGVWRHERFSRRWAPRSGCTEAPDAAVSSVCWGAWGRTLWRRREKTPPASAGRWWSPLACTPSWSRPTRGTQPWRGEGGRHFFWLILDVSGIKVWNRAVILPLRLSVEQSAGRVDVDDLLVDQSPVTLLRILLCCVPEETAADSFLDSYCGFSTRNYVQFVSEEMKT